MTISQGSTSDFIGVVYHFIVGYVLKSSKLFRSGNDNNNLVSLAGYFRLSVDPLHTFWQSLAHCFEHFSAKNSTDSFLMELVH